MWQDNVNGIYEVIGGFFILLHCLKLHKDKTTKGVSVKAFIFFASWGIWNLYYYPHLNQWWSFYGGCHIVFWNIIWIIFAIYYRRKDND